MTCLPILPVYKDGGKEKRKQENGKNEGNHKYSSSVRCYFVRTESGWDRDEPYIFSNKQIDEVRKSFMHIHTVPTVAKYVARLGILLLLFRCYNYLMRTFQHILGYVPLVEECFCDLH